MDTTKAVIPMMCEECDQRMKLDPDGIWRCLCGHSEPDGPPRQVKPVANVQTFTHDDRPAEPI